MSIINDRIKERRIASGLTLMDVANYLGVKEATAQRYESGAIKSIGHNTIISLSNLFHCTPSYLMGWDEIQFSKEESVQDITKSVESFYGKSTKDALNLYIQLDPDDQGEIRGEMKQMLKAEKYSAKKSKHA